MAEREDPRTRDCRAVRDAAAALRISEYDLFSLAYEKWWGERPTDAMLEPVFVQYLYEEAVPFYVRHFTRDVLDRWRRGALDRAAMGADRYRWVLPATVPIRPTAKTAVALIVLYLVLAAGIYLAPRVGGFLCDARGQPGVWGSVADWLIDPEAGYCEDLRKGVDRRKGADRRDGS